MTKTTPPSKYKLVFASMAFTVVAFAGYWYLSLDDNDSVNKINASGNHSKSDREIEQDTHLNSNLAAKKRLLDEKLLRDSAMARSGAGLARQNDQQKSKADEYARALVDASPAAKEAINRPTEVKTELSPRQEKIRQQFLYHQYAANKGMIDSAMALARQEAACASGQQKACAKLDASGGKGRKELQNMQEKLEKSCNQADPKACVNLGDVVYLGAKSSDSKTYYQKGRTIAEQTQSRCQKGEEKSSEICKNADKLLAAIKNRETKLAGH